MAAVGAKAFHQALAVFQPAHDIPKKYFGSVFIKTNATIGAALILHVTTGGKTLEHLDKMLTRDIKNLR